MSRGKYLSLEEAQKLSDVDRFAEEHPSQGDAKLFDNLLDEMAKTPESDDQTSDSTDRPED